MNVLLSFYCFIFIYKVKQDRFLLKKDTYFIQLILYYSELLDNNLFSMSLKYMHLIQFSQIVKKSFHSQKRG